MSAFLRPDINIADIAQVVDADVAIGARLLGANRYAVARHNQKRCGNNPRGRFHSCGVSLQSKGHEFSAVYWLWYSVRGHTPCRRDNPMTQAVGCSLSLERA